MNFVRVLQFLMPKPQKILVSTNAASSLLELVRSLPCEIKTIDAAPNAALNSLQGIYRAGLTLCEFPGETIVVWAHHSDSNRWLQLALALSRRKFVVVEQLVPTSSSDFARSRLTIPIKRFVARRAWRIIVNGWSQREIYRSVFGLKKVNLEVIPGSRPIGQIAARVASLRQDRALLRQRLGLGASPVALCIARLTAQKDQASLIRAMARLAAVGGQMASLVLVGDGPDKPMLQCLAEALVPGRVLFAGHQEDPVPWMAVADLFVLPSLAEGLPGALIEAMAARLPCVATRIPGNIELARHGHTGLSVPIKDPNALAAAMQHLLADASLAAKLAQAGYALVAREYDHILERNAWQRLFANIKQNNFRFGLPN